MEGVSLRGSVKVGGEGVLLGGSEVGLWGFDDGGGFECGTV